MSYQTIDYAVAAGIARLRLNRPERLNSFNTLMHHEVRHALTALAADTEARVLILTGAGRGFCAGQDLGDRPSVPAGAPADLGESIERYYNPLILMLRRLPVPVIAAVNGVAAGAGANIAFACDLVLAARSASFVQAFARIGLVPDCGGTWFVPRLAAAPTRALARAKQLIWQSANRTLEQQLDAERDAQRELGYSADYAEGVAAFIGKREPRFTGR